MPERCVDINEGCKYANTEQCIITTHHQMWPKRSFGAGIPKVFRELPENKERISRCDHDELHATTSPPERPSRAFMIQAIARQLTKDLEALHEPEVDPGMVLLSDDRSRPSLEVHMAGELTGRVAYAQEEV